jgi:CRP/FNR family cyclic AMP-dependent transcriptional regulator
MNWQKLLTWLKRLIGSHSELAYLRKFTLLKDFSDRELYLFSQLLHRREYKAGEFLYREDYPLAVIYLILKGEIDVQDNQASNISNVVLHKHQFLGIVDMYNDSRRNGSAKAMTDSEVLALSRQDFRDFIKSNPHSGVKLMDNIANILSRYIAQTSQTIEVEK